MDGIQTLLAIVIVSLTLLLMVVGFSVLLMVLELKTALRRLNSILGDAILGGGLIRPSKLMGILEMFGKKKKMETHGQG